MIEKLKSIFKHAFLWFYVFLILPPYMVIIEFIKLDRGMKLALLITAVEAVVLYYGAKYLCGLLKII